MPAIVETEISLDGFKVRAGEQAAAAAVRRRERHAPRMVAGSADAAAMLAVGSTDLARLCRRLL